ncbi:MAG TPA: hypothetical protein VK956_08515 [Verrucomicrobium sp.]|nr:hypothetical protein [Verrucomicrobium sp.]
MLNILRRWLSTGSAPSAEALCQDEEGNSVLQGDGDWWLEIAGERVTLLTDPQWEDMFWTSFRVEPVTADPILLAQLATSEFRNTIEIQDRVVWRHRTTQATAPNAFPGMNPQTLPERITMRGLYA